MSRLCFKWTKEHLIAANTGRAFSVGGLEALCSSHRSDKKDCAPRDFTSEQDAADKVEELKRGRLANYERIQGDITEHARAEKEMGLDYSNRLLLELMQNADDAAAAMPIGYKGLGFKAVLDICESVRIRSGFLRVRFDREESRKALLASNLPIQADVPVLRLPFLDDGEFAFPEVEDTQSTTIVLPWNSASDRKELFAQEWQSISVNPTILLLLHSLEEVVWQPLHGNSIVWRCKRTGDVSELSVQLGNSKPECSHWQVFRDPLKKTRSAVVVPLGENDQPRRYRHDQLRVFFPTEENSPLPLLLHGEFDLEQNRKRVRPGGNRKEVVQSLARCVRAVLSAVRDDGTFLDLLTPRNGMHGLELEIWEAVQSNASDMLLPQSQVSISSVRLCPEATAEDFPWYSHQRLTHWQAFKELLRLHRPGALTGLHLLAPGVDNDARELVVRSFNSKAHLSVEELRKLPLLPTEGSEYPVGTFDCHLFFPHKNGQLQRAPEGIQIGFVGQGFAADCDKYPDVKCLVRALGVSDFTPHDIAKALAGQRLEAASPELLWNYLMAVVAPLLKDSDAMMDWRDKSRENLIKRIRVPCRNQNWKPAVEVYAGREWTNDDFLERDYGANRHYLLLPPTDEAAKKLFEHLARWLGVGWSPKILPVANTEDKSGTREGIPWRNGSFQVSPQPERWREHCSENNREYDNAARTARLRQDWVLDGDAGILQMNGAFNCIVREWRNYEDYLESVIYRSSNMQEDYDNVKLWRTPSYVSHLFKNVAWIPADGCEAAKSSCDIFMTGCEVQQSLPWWVFASPVYLNLEIQRGLGIRTSWREVNSADWRRWLTQAAESNAKQDASFRAAILKLYAQVLVKAESFRWFDPNGVWCVQKRADNRDEWHLESSRQNVFYIDRPDLARLRLEGIQTFPAELGWSGNKQKISEVFGISPLSEYLLGNAEFKNQNSNDQLIEKITKQLHDRADCLAAYLRTKGKDALAAAEKWKEIEFRVGPELRVTFVLNNRELESQLRPTFFQPKSHQTRCALWLDADENFTDKGQPKDIVWEEVGAALCYAAGLALEDGTVFTSLLGCGEDSLKRKLLYLGVTESEIRTVLTKESLPQPVAKPTSPPAVKEVTVSLPVSDVQPQPEKIEATQPTDTSATTLDDIVSAGDPLEKLRQASKKLASETPQRVETIVSRTVRNDTELVQALKELCEFRCQFPGCGKQIRKKDGGFYIEVAHVKPIAKGGTSILGNVVVLCPNHHKEFDYGDLQVIEQTEELLHGKLNGVEFRISLPRPRS